MKRTERLQRLMETVVAGSSPVAPMSGHSSIGRARKTNRSINSHPKIMYSLSEAETAITTTIISVSLVQVQSCTSVHVAQLDRAREPKIIAFKFSRSKLFALPSPWG
jgi:tellurite resistance protein